MVFVQRDPASLRSAGSVALSAQSVPNPTHRALCHVLASRNLSRLMSGRHGHVINVPTLTTASSAPARLRSLFRGGSAFETDPQLEKRTG